MVLMDASAAQPWLRLVEKDFVYCRLKMVIGRYQIKPNVVVGVNTHRFGFGKS
jgi:hypothetical protein